MSQSINSVHDEQKERILLITIRLEGERKGARESLNRLNAKILKDIYGEGFYLHELPDCWDRNPIAALFGFIDGLSSEFIKAVVDKIQQNDIKKVFIDGSNLGRVAKEINRKCPSVTIATYYHNVEARFFWGAAKEFHSIKSMFITIVNYLAERKSVKYSDLRIMLNQRDSGMLQRIYGRGATHVSPLIVPDVRALDSGGVSEVLVDRYALFVGGSFYANQSGVEWYVENVAPYMDIKTVIVGRGFDDQKEKLERHDNVLVVGEVVSVDPWYKNASFVVAPIFDGSGMKTKVAEALMFGKKILGTPEAFCGYEDALPTAGSVCLTADDFIKYGTNLIEESLDLCDSDAVKIYEVNYSSDAAKERYKRILSE